MGSSEFDNASRIVKNALITTFILIIPPCLLVGLYPQCLYNVLNIQDEQKEFLPKLLPLISLGAVVQTGRYSVNQVLRQFKDNKGSTMTSVINRCCCCCHFGVGD